MDPEPHPGGIGTRTRPAYSGRGWRGIRKSEARIRTKNVTDPEISGKFRVMAAAGEGSVSQRHGSVPKCPGSGTLYFALLGHASGALPVPKCTDPDPGNAPCL